MNLKQIARAAGVSQTTVTIVLHNRKGVSAETRARLTALLEENGYRIESDTDVQDNGLKHPRRVGEKVMFIKFRRSGKIIDGNPEYISSLIDEVDRYSSLAGLELVFRNATPSTLREIFEMTNEEQVLGIIFLGTEFMEEDRPLLKYNRKPIVILDNDLTKMGISNVGVHTWNSMRTKVLYLAARGHSEIGYIKNQDPTSIDEKHFDGFLAAMSDAGLKFKEENLFLVDPTLHGSYVSMLEFLEKGRHLPSAIVTNTDNIALGAMKAMQLYNVKIPENVSLIGEDNITGSMICTPRLTTCEVHAESSGKWAIRILLDHIEDPESPIIRFRVETSLVERESVCDFADHIPLQYPLHRQAAE